MPWNQSVVIIISDAHHDALERIWWGLGASDGPTHNFSVALASTTEPPATHWGQRDQQTPEWATMLNAMKQTPPVMPTLPGGYEPWGLTEETALAAAEAMILDIRETSPGFSAVGHFNEVIAAQGLQKVPTRSPIMPIDPRNISPDQIITPSA